MRAAYLVVDDALRVRKANDLATKFAGRKVPDVLGLGPGGAMRKGTPRSGVEAWVPVSVDGREQTRCLQADC